MLLPTAWSAALTSSSAPDLAGQGPLEGQGPQSLDSKPIWRISKPPGRQGAQKEGPAREGGSPSPWFDFRVNLERVCLLCVSVPSLFLLRW